MALTQAQKNRLDYLKKLVALRVDEYSESPDNIGEDDVNFGDFEYELDQSARKILTTVDRYYAIQSAKKAKYITAKEDTSKKCLTIPLPEDYLRFVSLNVSGWKTPCTNVISDSTKAYRMQQYDMRRGTVEQPKTFLVPYFEESYEAETVAVGKAYCTISTEPATDETIDKDTAWTSNDGVPATGTIDDVEDPDFVVVNISSNAVVVGSILTPDNADSWRLTVKYIAGETVHRPSFNLALEAYPVADKSIDSLIYVPALKSYEMPEELEDALVWYTIYRVLVISGRFESAKGANIEYQNTIIQLNKGFKGEDVGGG